MSALIAKGPEKMTFTIPGLYILMCKMGILSPVLRWPKKVKFINAKQFENSLPEI